MTNGHDSGGISSCDNEVHENGVKSKVVPIAPRSIILREDKKTDTVTNQARKSGH